MAIEWKRGDTFDFSGKITDIGVFPIKDFSGCSLKAHGRDSSDELIVEFDVSWIDAPTGLLRLKVPSIETTKTWQIGMVIYYDIELTLPDGSVYSTSTDTIKVVKDYTWQL